MKSIMAGVASYGETYQSIYMLVPQVRIQDFVRGGSEHRGGFVNRGSGPTTYVYRVFNFCSTKIKLNARFKVYSYLDSYVPSYLRKYRQSHVFLCQIKVAKSQ